MPYLSLPIVYEGFNCLVLWELDCRYLLVKYIPGFILGAGL